WDAGAVSEQALAPGNGYMLFAVEGRPIIVPSTAIPTNTPTNTPTGSPDPQSALNTRRAFGLTQSSAYHGDGAGNGAHRLQDLDYAFVLSLGGTSTLNIYENGVDVGYSGGTYDYNDLLKIAVENVSLDSY